jgi:ABC-type bacteriocin/lantibiotic exporter with double-glycine peptidase domain
MPLGRTHRTAGASAATVRSVHVAGALRIARVRALFPALTVVAGLALAAEVSWIDVPFVHQVRAGCGPASIAMVMQYWVQHQPGLDPAAADAERINEALPASSGGIFGNDLRTYLEAHGFSAFLFDGEPQDLAHHLAKGRPVVVCLGPKGPGGPLHYVVVVGSGENEILLNDSARGKLIRESKETFLKQWKATGNWALLAVPRPAR